jgi:hypothetical protein
VNAAVRGQLMARVAKKRAARMSRMAVTSLIRRGMGGTPLVDGPTA